MIGLGIGLGLRPSVGGPTPWTPDNLDPSYRTNGGWWEAGDQTVDSGAVTAWPDRWGVRAMTQSVEARRPTAGTVSGFPAAIWPDEGNDVSLDVAAAFAPAWWMFVIQYRDGAAGTFAGIDCFNGDGSATSARMMGATGAATLQAGSWSTQARKNGAAATSSTVLPLPLSMVSVSATPISTTWRLGKGSGGTLRGWKGPRVADLALGSVPTESERQRIEGYFAHKFALTASLPADHPYKASAPMVGA